MFNKKKGGGNVIILLLFNFYQLKKNTYSLKCIF